jgi:phosphoribosyl 1,2-cyclic phosphodiesterase
VLLDAGLGSRQLAERLVSAGVDPERLDAVFVTHEHGDHARGARAFSARFGVPLVGTRGTFLAAGWDGEKLAGYETISAGETRSIGRLLVKALPVPHDAAGPLAFVVSCGGASLGHATDLGHLGRRLVEVFQGCDALLVESNYDPAMLRNGPYPWSLKDRIASPRGHLSNGDVARYLSDGMGVACRSVVLAHLSQTNNHAELVRMSAEQALSRRGRSEVELTITDADGTGWIDVAPSPEPSGAKQLRLF